MLPPATSVSIGWAAAKLANSTWIRPSSARQVLHMGDMSCESTHLRVFQSAQRVLDQVFFRDVKSFSVAHASSAFLTAVNAVRMRVLTVPSGVPVRSEISVCVNPSK